MITNFKRERLTPTEKVNEIFKSYLESLFYWEDDGFQSDLMTEKEKEKVNKIIERRYYKLIKKYNG